MNAGMKEQIHKDYREALTNEAMMRILGGIFYACGTLTPGLKNDYMQGIRDIGVSIMNTIREVNPYGVADCLTAYEDMRRSYENGEYNGDDNRDIGD